MTYRVSAGGQYSCPRCLRALTTYLAGVFVVDACVDCGGLFIDNLATQELMRAFDRDLVSVATTLGIGKGETLPSGVIQKNLACPRCSGGLAAVSLPSAGVEVDICQEHGTWFDANELPKVARAYRRRREGKLGDMADDALADVLDGRFST
ncbi:MAG: zf-TFIIB domain-containing protein [Labilithrix sp.]|nr:zf-TFIIB domain-containing protein [Labilithrix sp.]